MDNIIKVSEVEYEFIIYHDKIIDDKYEEILSAKDDKELSVSEYQYLQSISNTLKIDFLMSL